MTIFNLLLSVTLVFAADFKTAHIFVGKEKIKVEIAETPTQHQQGLMNRTSMPADEGMLFIFPGEQIRSFWMKNTFLPLSIAFADNKGKILNILDMKPSSGLAQKEFPTYESEGPAQYALEMNQGWFHKKGIKPGAVIKIVR